MRMSAGVGIAWLVRPRRKIVIAIGDAGVITVSRVVGCGGLVFGDLPGNRRRNGEESFGWGNISLASFAIVAISYVYFHCILGIFRVFREASQSELYSALVLLCTTRFPECPARPQKRLRRPESFG